MKRIVFWGLAIPFFLNMMIYGLAFSSELEIEKGKKLYEEKRCKMCHAIGGQGGKVGPDLLDVGNKRDRDWLMKFLKDPKGTVTGAKMFPVRGSDEELSALVEYLFSLKQ